MTSERRERLATNTRPYPETIPLRDVARFMAKVDRSKGCWEWTASLNHYRGGYGQVAFAGTMRLAHRVAYELFVGALPKGHHLDHLCRNRACVNPDHLEAVLPGENIRRSQAPSAIAAREGRCQRGIHDLTDPAVTRVKPDGRKNCRPCEAQRRRERRTDLRAA